MKPFRTHLETSQGLYWLSCEGTPLCTPRPQAIALHLARYLRLPLAPVVHDLDRGRWLYLAKPRVYP
jgi:hypothetical protein